MLKKLNSKRLILLILIIGSILRLLLFYVNPPNNSYDDHLEVVKIYAEDMERPDPFQCWECYQPPGYYILGATVYKIAHSLNLNNYFAWKAVQIINPILSILMMIFFYKIIDHFNTTHKQKILYLSFVAFLPRDLFTSAMIGNDYLLIFCSTASFYYFIKCFGILKKEEKIFFSNFLLLSFFTVLGSLTKQHGLILLAFPGYIVLIGLIRKKHLAYQLLLPLFLTSVLLTFSDEAWKFSKTGKLLVSNQHYFDYAAGQFPGSLELVEFSTFRISKLMRDPFISNQTAASFPTEIFARAFYDYEYRFTTPKIPINHLVGKIGYTTGILWLAYFIWTLLIWAKGNYGAISLNKIIMSPHIISFLVGFLFIAVPFIQTIRFPYFSSMKTMFMLPGIIILIALHSLVAKNIKLPQSPFYLLSVLNMLYGVTLIIVIYIYLQVSVNHLSGPLWPIPN